MNNGIDKKALFKLKSEPYLKPISDLGVGFYNLDENTAILRFQLSNTKGPLLIHENNLTAYAYFESTNGSASDVIELEIEDSFNGIVTITLDKAFLQASTSTKVKGQVYIGVNNVDGKTEYNEVAVFREFNFEVADALINKISSFTKVEYIRMFSQLKEHIEQKVNDIEEAIANGVDYVAEMKSVLQKGIETLNAIITDGKTDIETYITQAKMDLIKVKDDATEDINTTANNSKTSVQDAASTAVNNINIKAVEVTEHVDEKVNEFNQTVEDNGFLSPQILDEELGKLNWQKYKLTEENGSNVFVNLDNNEINLHNLKPGSYYATLNPITGASSTSGFLNVSERKDVAKYITFKPYNSKQVWIKRFYDKWNNWERVDISQSDTGWIPFNIINGGRANTAYSTRGGYSCSYRIITLGTITKKILRVNADNVAHNQIIAQLPSGFAKELQVGYIRSTGDHNATNLLVETTGEVRLYVANSTQWSISDSKFIYGQISWIE